MVVNVAIEIPEKLSTRLSAHWGNLSRRALEALAAEAYRESLLTAHELQDLLEFRSRWEADAFLKKAHAYLDYSEVDLERDLVDIQAARGS